jgi:hypothetical protein
MKLIKNFMLLDERLENAVALLLNKPQIKRVGVKQIYSLPLARSIQLENDLFSVAKEEVFYISFRYDVV